MQKHVGGFSRLAIAAAMVLAAPLAVAQYKCQVNGHSVIQSEPCSAAVQKTGKYRCFVDGDVVYQDESCIKPKPEIPVAAPAPAPAASSRSVASASSSEDRMWIIQNKDLIKRKLRDPASAEFSGTFVSRISGSPVVCGYVNAKNAFGGYAGSQRFISAGTTVQVLASDMKAGEMENLWQQVCG